VLNQVALTDGGDRALYAEHMEYVPFLPDYPKSSSGGYGYCVSTTLREMKDAKKPPVSSIVDADLWWFNYGSTVVLTWFNYNRRSSHILQSTVGRIHNLHSSDTYTANVLNGFVTESKRVQS